jgi:hypothetical protein
MGTNCAPLLVDLFFVFISGGIYSKASTWEEKNLLLWPLIRHFNLSTTFYLLTIISSIHVDLIYSNELEIKDNKECSSSVLYLDIFLKLDTSGKMMTQLYDKCDDFNYPSSTSLSYVVISRPHLHMVYISPSWFGMQELVRHMISFKFEAVYWQTSWCHSGFKILVYRQLSANFMIVTTIVFAHTTFLWALCSLICFIPIVKPF